MAHLDEPHPFALDTATLHYAADRLVRAVELQLEVDLDFRTTSFTGVAVHTVEAVQAVDRVTFDAVELDVTHVAVDGKAVDFDTSGRHLHVVLKRSLAAGARAEITVRYKATPRRGLYFIEPDASNPKRPRQVWTQGQDEDSRFWFPCLDAPAQKCPTQVTAVFPSAMTSLSNGRLLADTTRAGRRRMTWRLDLPHSPYLVTLVVGEFDSVTQRHGKMSVRTLFPKGRRADALRCTARTPRMLAMLEKLSGQTYPWGDYAQVFVSEFIFGGMENTGATSLTDAVLHDARAALDYSAEYLIVHEAAHQWFGDLLTCRDWPHGWLNEGFATYAEVLWKEEADGIDEADHARKIDFEAYLSEVEERYARPIVARTFDAPIDLFDRHLYEKGGLVLHELRTRLGDADFWRVAQHYVAAHRHGSVETVDLARSVEAVTGKNIDRFFDEYVYRAGHPALSVNASYDALERLVRLEVKQTGPVTKLTLPVLIDDTAHRFEVVQKEHTFLVPNAREPKRCVVDAHRDLLAALDVKKPMGWWQAELQATIAARARTEAAVALGKDGSAASIQALAKVLLDESVFWGTRAACAKALGVVRTPMTREALLAALRVKHPKARRAVVAALGSFKGDVVVAKAIAALCTKGDASAFVEAEAARTLGKLRAPGAFELLAKLLTREAFQDVIRSGALDGLVELHDPRGWKVARDAAKPGAPVFARRSAVGALARLAEVANAKRETVELLSELLRDSSFRVRLATISAAQQLGDERLIGPLATTPFLDGREVRAAREAVRSLRASTPTKELHALRSELDALKGEVRVLKEKLDVGAAKSTRRR